jgi:glycosyltransferase involved in cell wall biosynthesis
MRLGAVPEIIDEGVTGYCADSAEKFAELVLRSFTLDRRRVRARAEERFSARRMARGYNEVYQRLVGAAASGRAPNGRAGAWQR